MCAWQLSFNFSSMVWGGGHGSAPGLAFYTKFQTNSESILAKGLIARRAVIKAGMISFAAYTAAETANAFQWIG